ncbi:MAG: threonine synthase, partial [Aquificaceae bacterium]|nr:threonine synthase [Aquificaceae bacterium]
KDDSVNHPTLSFKDRVVAVALSKAIEMGFDTGACASTGNLANSVASHCAQAGLNCFVFIPANLELQKIIGSLVFNPTVVAVEGDYDDVNRLCSEIANDLGWAFVNVNLRPYYAEGSKTLAFEVIEQLNWQVPDAIVVPVASGSLMTKIYKGIEEFFKVGLIDSMHTRIYGAQALGCSPVAKAWREGKNFVNPVKPNTIAKSIAIGNPADGIYALEVARKTGGGFEVATDEEIVEGIRLLAKTEGIFTETAGGTTVAVLKKLAASGLLREDEIVVAYITGNGYKTAEVLEGSLQTAIRIKPTLADFKEKVLVNA